MTVLEFENVSYSYDGRRRILDGVSFSLAQGEAAAVTGASGCGKSTLALIACGVIPKSVDGEFSGTVRVMGEDIADKKIFETAKHISMVFQDPESQLFAPEVIDEVAFAPENLCFTPEDINKSIEAALGTVGMSAFMDYSPNNLSGGQQQLIALASVLTLDPEVIVLDEVAAQIDEEGVKLIIQAVKELKKRGKTVLIIEHGDALSELYDTVYRIDSGRMTKL